MPHVYPFPSVSRILSITRDKLDSDGVQACTELVQKP